MVRSATVVRGRSSVRTDERYRNAGGPIPEKIEPEPVTPEPAAGLAADPGESLAELAEESTTSDEIDEEVQEGPEASGEDAEEPEEDEEPRS